MHPTRFRPPSRPHAGPVLISPTSSPSLSSPVRENTPAPCVPTRVQPAVVGDSLQRSLPGADAEKVAIVLGLLTGAGPALGNLAVADTMCNPLGPLRHLSRTLHPTGLMIDDNVYFGCLVGAVLITSGATLLSFSALAALRKMDKNGDGILGRDEIQGSCLKHIPVVKDSEALDLAAVVRHPNTILVVFIFLYQGTAFSALRLAVGQLDQEGRDVPVWGCVAGGVFAGALVAFPIWVGRAVSNGLAPVPRKELPGMGPQPRARVRPWDDPKPPRWLQWVMLSEHGDWVSCFRGKHWIGSWDAAVRNFEAEHAGSGVAMELGVTWALSFVNAFPTWTWQACGHSRASSAFVHLVQLVYCVRLRPYRCLRDDIARCLVLALMTAAHVNLAVAFYRASEKEQALEKRDPEADFTDTVDVSVTVVLLRIVAYVVLVQVALRMVAEVLLLAKGWRANSQTLEWAETEARLEDLGGSPLLTEDVVAPPSGRARAPRPPSSPRLFEPLSVSPLSPAPRCRDNSSGRAGSRGRGTALLRSPGSSLSADPGMALSIIDLVVPGGDDGDSDGKDSSSRAASRLPQRQAARRIWSTGRGSAQTPVLYPRILRQRATTARGQDLLLGSREAPRSRRRQKFSVLGDPTTPVPDRRTVSATMDNFSYISPGQPVRLQTRPASSSSLTPGGS
eukprot:TRINITY_DN14442_c1_g3_i1.p1 TRINITY_DN14442_c1_g3~~TRINITY_DN14442_c1_g3_i1.p1  ORF type:complete len:677 (+),score=80.98 TRINITY_DN14442_c1_g3_i1:1586-3616(+)